jgi:hypothetical protein
MDVLDLKHDVVCFNVNDTHTFSTDGLFIIRDLNFRGLLLVFNSKILNYCRSWFATIADYLGSAEVRVQDIQRESQLMEGAVVKRLQLHGVHSGEIIIKFQLQINV